MLLTDLFAASVARWPDRPAVDVPPGEGRAQRTVVAYRELAAMANGVAAAVAERVPGEANVVVLLARTTPWLYAAQLGVLQAGAAHVCLDPSFPDAHVAHVTRDCGAVAVVTDAAGAVRCRALGVPVVEVPLRGALPAAPLPRPTWANARSLAYAIYTSGTTGTPKGVLIEHGGAVNLIASGIERFAMSPGDRVAQGSSAAYDSSVEETWLALASGACVVALDDATVRLGPDLTAWLRNERVTVFCPPPTLLRAMDVRSVRGELPDLRLCYVGGEALPQDLADRWADDVWLENGYGPTECTVTVVRGRVRARAPVTIGTPVPPHVAWILGDDGAPVADGEAGELCIAGPGLARGYLGQPELTAQRFPVLPGVGRVYRTGDLVHRAANGELVYGGRIDAQVKIRGHRIELEAIEAVLARCAGVREVAACAQDEGGQRVLVAHVVPADPAAVPDFRVLAAAVRAVLPEPTVPARFGTLAALPRTVGGKLDRRALPVLAAPLPAASANGGNGSEPWQPGCAVELALRDGFAAVLHVPPAAIARDGDFFALGGDSLRAATLVSRLRRIAGCERVAVRDVYAARTAGALAAWLTRSAAPAAARTGPRLVPPAPPPLRTPWAATAVQVAFLLALLTGVSTAAWLGAFVVVPWLARTVSLTQLLLLAPFAAAVAMAAWTVAVAALAVAAKRALIGRYRPLRAPVWSALHVRHWIVVRLVRLVPWTLLDATEAKNALLRALGARIGERVHVHRCANVLDGGWDLLELGDDVTLAREAHVAPCELDDGHVVFDSVRIGAGATLATRAGVGPGATVGAGALVGALAYVAPGTVVPPGELWRGVPAVRAGAAPPRAAVDVPSRELSGWAYTALVLVARLSGPPLAALPFAAALALAATAGGVDAVSFADWFAGAGPASNVAWCALAVALTVAVLPLALLGSALVLRWSPGVPAGTHARWSAMHLRLQLRTDAVEAAGGWLAGTLLWPAWLRLAGMRIGRDVEISSILDVLPEHVRLGAHSFLADGIYLGVPHQHQGRVTVLPAELGERSFLGNHVVVDGGQRLPPELVLGVSTVADAATMARGTGWFGQPPFVLPRRDVAAMDRALTHAPGVLRYANRVAWELARFCVPALPATLALVWLDVVASARTGGAGAVTAVLATAGAGAALVVAVLATKWLLLGRVRPGRHGLWSSWASRWDLHYVLWERWGRGVLAQLEGTLLLPWFLRAIGMRIGRRCVLGDGFAQVVDPDMIAIGDGATVQALFQAHSFEDRVLKMDRVTIGARANVGRGTVVLYGAEIQPGARVLPHGVVMKNELLLAGRCYAGAPTAEVPLTPALPAVVPSGAAIEPRLAAAK
jgi:non-ribosomal peptide synthetase-like protein